MGERSSRIPGASRPESPASPQAWLFCIGGPMDGHQFPLEQDEYVIGRSSENAISIPDTSVSRRHLLLRREGRRWVASDLGSGNGTLVNNEPIIEDTVLASGDILVLGDTELRFVEGSGETVVLSSPPAAPPASRSRSADVPRPSLGGLPAAAAPRSAPTPVVPSLAPSKSDSRMRPQASRTASLELPAPRQSRLVLKAVLFSLLCLALAAALVVTKRQRDAEAELLAREAQAQALQQERARRDALFQEAKGLVREGKWADAQERLLQLKQLEPGYPELPSYLAYVDKELANSQALAEAESALEARQLSSAVSALKRVSPDTQLLEPLSRLQRKLQELADQQLEEARGKLAAGQAEEALPLVKGVLEAQPESAAARALERQASEALASSAAEDTSSSVAKAPSPSAARPPPPRPWDEAVARYMEGRVSEAHAMLAQCEGRETRCKVMRGQMKEVRRLLQRLRQLDEDELADLVDLDQQITDSRGSKLVRAAGPRGAELLYVRARAAQSRGQWEAALKWAQRTLAVDPEHVGARTVISSHQQKSTELYERVQQHLKAGEASEAIKLLREVIDMTPPGDELHQKARTQQAELLK